jgi:type II secretion system protein H
LLALRVLLNPGARARGRSGALTLVELLVVLALLGVMAGVIVPRMGGSLGRQELREAAGRLAHTARTVRELAVARQQLCALEIGLDAGGYRIVTQAGRSGAGQWQMLQASWLKADRWPVGVTVAAYRTPDGATATSGTQYLKFFPDGTSSGAALRLVRGQDSCQVVVHPHSGRVVYGDARTAEFVQDQYDLGD